MLKNVLYKAVLFTGVCLACAACSQEDDATPYAGGGEGVTVLYRVADAPATRAMEDGWTGDWHENTVSSLVLFQFAANGELKDRILPSNLSSFDAQNGTFYTFNTNSLTYNELADNPTDVFYLVANCPQLETATINSVADLQAAMINGSLDFDGQQQSFVMDARPYQDSTHLYKINPEAKTATLSLTFTRDTSKIPCAFNTEYSNTHFTSSP